MKIFNLALLLPILFLSSCSLLTANGEAIKLVESLIRSIGNDNINDTKSLFSSNIVENIPNIDYKLTELINYFDGEYENILTMTTGAKKEQDGFKVIRFLDYNNWEIKTSKCYYYFSIYWCVRDDYNSKNIGIWNLCLQKYELGELPISIDWKEWGNSDKYRGVTLR